MPHDELNQSSSLLSFCSILTIVQERLEASYVLDTSTPPEERENVSVIRLVYQIYHVRSMHVAESVQRTERARFVAQRPNARCLLEYRCDSSHCQLAAVTCCPGV